VNEEEGTEVERRRRRPLRRGTGSREESRRRRREKPMRHDATKRQWATAEEVVGPAEDRHYFSRWAAGSVPSLCPLNGRGASQYLDPMCAELTLRHSAHAQNGTREDSGGAQSMSNVWQML
jgi:hypothetical protein